LAPAAFVPLAVPACWPDRCADRRRRRRSLRPGRPCCWFPGVAASLPGVSAPVESAAAVLLVPSLPAVNLVLSLPAVSVVPSLPWVGFRPPCPLWPPELPERRRLRRRRWAGCESPEWPVDGDMNAMVVP